MDVHFIGKDVEALYTKGTCRAYRELERTVINKFFSAIAIIDAATTTHDIMAHPSYRFEKLQGYEKRYSMRLSIKWRLEMEVDWTNETKTVGIFGIDEISNHYGD